MKYTEKDLIKILEYACGYQKATSYQEIGAILLSDEKYIISDEDILVLNNLSNDKNAHKEISITDINDYLNGL